MGVTSGSKTDLVSPRPEGRLDHYSVESARLKFEQQEGRPVSTEDVQMAAAAVCKVLAQSLDTLPDALEREFALEPESVHAMVQDLDTVREQLYEVIREAVGEDEAEELQDAS